MGVLDGKTAIVTGAGRGIGLGVAHRFVQEGADVWFLDRDQAVADDAVQQLGPRAHPLTADVADLESLEAAFASVAGRIDIVVANAGIQLIGRDAAIADVPLDVWKETMNVNLAGTFYTLRVSVRRMLEQSTNESGSRGSIIVTGSATGITGVGAGFAAYSASKAGVHGLARTTAADYAKHGIRVNTVVPGHTLTPLVEALRNDSARAASIDAQIPLGRPGTVDDCVGAYVFLAGDDSVYMTGSAVYVDGGRTNL